MHRLLHTCPKDQLDEAIKLAIRHLPAYQSGATAAGEWHVPHAPMATARGLHVRGICRTQARAEAAARAFTRLALVSCLLRGEPLPPPDASEFVFVLHPTSTDGGLAFTELPDYAVPAREGLAALLELVQEVLRLNAVCGSGLPQPLATEPLSLLAEGALLVVVPRERVTEQPVSAPQAERGGLALIGVGSPTAERLRYGPHSCSPHRAWPPLVLHPNLV